MWFGLTPRTFEESVELGRPVKNQVKSTTFRNFPLDERRGGRTESAGRIATATQQPQNGNQVKIDLTVLTLLRRTKRTSVLGSGGGVGLTCISALFGFHPFGMTMGVKTDVRVRALLKAPNAATNPKLSAYAFGSSTAARAASCTRQLAVTGTPPPRPRPLARRGRPIAVKSRRRDRPLAPPPRRAARLTPSSLVHLVFRHALKPLRARLHRVPRAPPTPSASTAGTLPPSSSSPATSTPCCPTHCHTARSWLCRREQVGTGTLRRSSLRRQRRGQC